MAKPSKGTPKDMRLKENQQMPTKPMQKAMTKAPKSMRPKGTKKGY